MALGFQFTKIGIIPLTPRTGTPFNPSSTESPTFTPNPPRMNLFQWTKGVFGFGKKKFDPSVWVTDPAKEAQTLKDRYGGDFAAFFYRRDLYDVLNRAALPILQPRANNDFLAASHWREKHPFNFPGPFYTGETDTCGTGVPEAPENVLFDGYCCEYIFRQPRNYQEFIDVKNAAAIEVFDRYACDGNQHWTPQACREWWGKRDEFIHRLLHDPEYRKQNGERGTLYVDYLNSSAGRDLQKYLFFLENGRYPREEGTPLPEL
jgi:hypothetical protein